MYVFDACGYFYEGYACVELKGKCNWIDREGNLLSPNQWFYRCGNFKDGVARVWNKGNRNWIDKEGNLYDYVTMQSLGTNVNDKRKNESKIRKNVIRLTESDLRFMIEECISNILYS